MARGIWRRVLGLGMPPVLFSALDATMTLLGQSPSYWAGDYRIVNEMSPTFRHLLQINPLAFLGGIWVWMAVFVGIIVLLPETLALIIALAVTFGHAAGAATWFMYRGGSSYQLANGLCLVSAVVLAMRIRLGYRAYGAGEYSLDRWPASVRWGLSAVLFGVGVYVFLLPR
jgi:hypothetical protein